MFTVEFYAEISRYLTEDGLLCQWMHGYELSDELLLSVFAALDSRVRRLPDLSGRQPGLADLGEQATRTGVGDLHGEALEWPELAAEAGLLGVHSRSQIEALLVANDELLGPYLKKLKPNSDAHPLLDVGAEKARFFRRSAEAMLELRFVPLPIIEILGGIERMPYTDRIPDRRVDDHVLEEPERALLQMRLFEIEDRNPYAGSASIDGYFTARDLLEAKPGDVQTAERWLSAVFDVYYDAAPWIRLEQTAFWAEVLEIGRSDRVTAPVRRGVELFDAALRRDGPRMRRLAQVELDASDSTVHARMSALIGALGLVIEGAPAEARRAFAREYLRPHARPDSRASPDVAFSIVLAWMED